MSIRYSPKSGRAYDDETGRFVSYSRAQKSSIFREEFVEYHEIPVRPTRDEYIEYLERKAEREAERAKVFQEELALERAWKRVEVPREWKKIEVLPRDIKSMYELIQEETTKEKWEDFVEEIESLRTSNQKRKRLQAFYNKIIRKAK